MHSKQVLIIAGLILGWVFPAQTFAAGTTGAEFLGLEVPASCAAVGAGVAVASGNEGVTWNPAGIAGQQDPVLALTHIASLADTGYEQFEGYYPAGAGNVWAGRLFYASTYNFSAINEVGNETGSVENHDLLLNLAYARDITQWGCSLGIGVKLFQSALAGFSSQGAAVDAGLQYQLPALPVRLGLAIQNLGGMSAFEKEADPLPLLMLAGLSWDWEMNAGNLLRVNADFKQPLAGDERSTPVVGLVYAWDKVIFARVGYRLSRELGEFSVGGGVQLSGFGLDYAFQPYDGLGNSHRFTFSYVFPRFARELNQQPDLENTTAIPVSLKTASHLDLAMQDLKAAPQMFAGKLRFTPPTLDPKIRNWEFTVMDQDGKIVKQFRGVGSPPKELTWEGKDDQGGVVPQTDKYHYIFKADGRELADQKLPALEPVLKLRFVDGATLEPGVQFSFQSKPEVLAWQLFIRTAEDKKVVRVLSNQAALPMTLWWDGRNQQGEVVDTRLVYIFDLNLVLADNAQVRISDTIQPVVAVSLLSASGKKIVVIPGILFEFNSATLNPVMTNKCLAAVELIRRNPEKTNVLCEGHADDIGSAAANYKLSKQRAHMVAKFLGKYPFVISDRISLVGYGKSRPVARFKNESARAQNRRVEIRLSLQP